MAVPRPLGQQKWPRIRAYFRWEIISSRGLINFIFLNLDHNLIVFNHWSFILFIGTVQNINPHKKLLPSQMDLLCLACSWRYFNKKAFQDFNYDEKYFKITPHDHHELDKVCTLMEKIKYRDMKSMINYPSKNAMFEEVMNLWSHFFIYSWRWKNASRIWQDLLDLSRIFDYASPFGECHLDSVQECFEGLTKTG